MEDNREFAVIIGTAHRLREPGKCSPDGKFREALYSRDIAQELKCKIESYGIKAFIDWVDTDLPKHSWTNNYKTERFRELSLRVQEVNTLCKKYDCIYISLHNDASGSDGMWHDANGWSAWVCPQASQKSRMLAECLADAAKANDLKVRQPTRTQKYWENSLYVLGNTNCPAVLTENLFQDNKKDVAFLTSEDGRHTIIRTHIEGILRYVEEISKS